MIPGLQDASTRFHNSLLSYLKWRHPPAQRAFEIHGGFLPLLGLHTVSELVRTRKQGQGEIGVGGRLLCTQRFTLENIEIETT
jgi:hypothetical protein